MADDNEDVVTRIVERWRLLLQGFGQQVPPDHLLAGMARLAIKEVGEHVTMHGDCYGPDNPLNVRIVKSDDTVSVDLVYPPRTEADNAARRCRYVEIGLECVRASDGFRVHYDFERDGWCVEQQSKFSWTAEEDHASGGNPDRGWKETGFIQSWAADETEEDGDA